ncbi:MAG: carboxypeptidase-like regulatory domain-containing protein [Sediminibacterium sp.]|nr:MAG: carboxypeptidase-like regulatory domain-containing protein [Sediminibacterium sp.]
MFKKIYTLVIFISVLWVQIANAQDLHGTIIDKAEGTPLMGASIKLAGINKGGISNDKGEFVITNIAAGTIHIIISHTGFEVLDTSFQFTGKNNIPIVIGLIAAKEELEEVIIVSSSRTNSRIEDLPTKVEVLGSEEVKEENGIKPGK